MEFNGVSFYVLIGFIALGLCALIIIIIRKRRNKQDKNNEKEQQYNDSDDEKQEQDNKSIMEEKPKSLSLWKRLFGGSTDDQEQSWWQRRFGKSSNDNNRLNISDERINTDPITQPSSQDGSTQAPQGSASRKTTVIDTDPAPQGPHGPATIIYTDPVPQGPQGSASRKTTVIETASSSIDQSPSIRSKRLTLPDPSPQPAFVETASSSIDQSPAPHGPVRKTPPVPPPVPPAPQPTSVRSDRPTIPPRPIVKNNRLTQPTSQTGAVPSSHVNPNPVATKEPDSEPSPKPASKTLQSVITDLRKYADIHSTDDGSAENDNSISD